MRVSASTRKAVASICETARVNAVWNPTSRRQSYETFLANQTNFDALAVRKNRQNGNHPGITEIDRLQKIAGFMQYVVNFEANEFQLREQVFAFSRREARAELRYRLGCHCRRTEAARCQTEVLILAI